MKKLSLCLAAMAASFVFSHAQNTQDAAAAAAAALSKAEDVPVKVEKPKYWTSTLLTNINFGQTYLSQWAAGGYNNVTLAGNADYTAAYAKGKLIGTNRLQLDYGFLYSADKPIIQKNKDRIYFESKWGYETPVHNLAYSASFDFKTQFDRNYDYKTPSDYTTDEPSREDWKKARLLKSGLFAPAYINVGIGALWTPAPWFSLNVAPLSGGAVIVGIEELRYTYGMELKENDSKEARKEAHNAGQYDKFSPVRMEFGLQVKADASWVINDTFSYTTQATLFYNYLTPKTEPRITWDNKIFWKLRRFFALTVATNLIYDPLVIVRDTAGDGVADSKGVQFKEFLEFGFTYTISRKR